MYVNLDNMDVEIKERFSKLCEVFSGITDKLISGLKDNKEILRDLYSNANNKNDRITYINNLLLNEKLLLFYINRRSKAFELICNYYKYSNDNSIGDEMFYNKWNKDVDDFLNAKFSFESGDVEPLVMGITDDELKIGNK